MLSRYRRLLNKLRHTLLSRDPMGRLTRWNIRNPWTVI
jgi:hypothetical protein